MKFECTKKDLLTAMKNVSKFIARKPAYDLLNYCKITTNGNSLEITTTDTTTDYQTFATISIDAIIHNEGKILIRCKDVIKILSKLNNCVIKCELINDYLTISNENIKTTVLALTNVEDYPTTPILENACSVDIPANKLKEMINNVAFAVAKTDQTQQLAGCLLSIKDDSIDMVALDGFMLAMQTYEGNFNIEKDITINGKILNNIAKMIKWNDTNNAKLLIAEKRVIIQIDNITINANLIGGTFVNYNAILPNLSISTLIEVNTAEMLLATQQANSLKPTKNIVIYDTKTDAMVIHSESENGSCSNEIDTKTINEPFEIAFNGEYVEKALKHISSDTVKMYYQSQTSPCVFTSDNNVKFLIMSVRI